jgi:flagellar hook assembly protein FlgD
MGEAGATIRYTLPNPATVTIDVFNAAGALVRRIDEGARPAGQHSVPWDGRSKNGAALQSGVYVARMLTPEGTTTGRVVLAK